MTILESWKALDPTPWKQVSYLFKVIPCRVEPPAPLSAARGQSLPGAGILERRGGTRSATFHLTKGVAKDLLGKAAYTKRKGIAPARYAEIVRQYVRDHGSIRNKDCRELLGLGDSSTAQVEASRYLKRWSQPGGFLIRGGPPAWVYRFREEP